MVWSNRTGQFQSNRLGLLLSLLTLTAVVAPVATARPLRIRVNRWLELRRLSGSVELLDGGRWSPAQQGQRLDMIGDGLRTGAGSLARLAVDTQVGFVTVSENTTFTITEMYTTASGAKVTEIDVSRGRANIFVRPFTNPESRMEIRTPAGVNGVRGTDFGISIQPSGRSALVVEEGQVEASAQGVTVAVDGGFQNFTVPGEPPSPPVPITEDPRLNLLRFERQRREGALVVVLEGNTPAVNFLVIDGVTQEIDREGNFNLELPLPADQQIEATVVTPLGKTRIYELVVP